MAGSQAEISARRSLSLDVSMCTVLGNAWVRVWKAISCTQSLAAYARRGVRGQLVDWLFPRVFFGWHVYESPVRTMTIWFRSANLNKGRGTTFRSRVGQDALRMNVASQNVFVILL